MMAETFWQLQQRWWQALDDLEAAPDDEASVMLEAELNRLTTELMTFPAREPDEVRAKLEALISLIPIQCGGDDGFPWPELRLIAAALAA